MQNMQSGEREDWDWEPLGYIMCHSPDLTAMTKPGGWSEVQVATQEIQKICDRMKPFAEEKLQKTFDVFNGKSFAEQIVQGKIVKAHVGSDEFIHLKVFQSLHREGGKLELHDLQNPKTKDEPLIHF